MSNYSEQLKDPRWQRKRLEILTRDDFKCRMCGKSEKTLLHIHHQYYVPGAKPWEHGNDLLISLCEDCHRKEEARKENDLDLVKTMLSFGITREQISGLTNGMFGALFDSANPRETLQEIINYTKYLTKPENAKQDTKTLV